MTNLKFHLVEGSSVDGIIASLQAAMPDAVIDIHVERGETEVKARPSGYASPAGSMREFYENEEAREEHEPYVYRPECTCPVCVTKRREMHLVEDYRKGGNAR